MSGTGVITASVPLDGSGKAAPAAGTGAGAPNPAAAGTAAPGVDGVAAGVPAAGAAAAGSPEASAPVNPAELNKKEEVGAPVKTEEQARAEAATGLDLTPFSQEFNTNGKLSEESYKTLEGKGFTRQITDTYIAGVQAKAAAHHTALSQAVGGVENWNSIMEWGKTGLSDAEKQETVRALSNTDNVDSAKTYLLGLQARFIAANGKVPGKIAGGGAAPQGDVFTSRAEQAKAMKDPRYKTDPAYRNDVVQKSVRSFGSGTKARVKAKAKPAARRSRAKTTTRRAPKGKR